MRITTTSFILILYIIGTLYSELIEMDDSKYGAAIYDTERNVLTLKPVVKTEFEKYDSRIVEENEIPLELHIESDKDIYSLNEPIILTIRLTYTGNDTIRFNPLIEPIPGLYHERIGRFISDDSLEVEYPLNALACVSYTRDAFIYLTNGESYEVKFKLNAKLSYYPGDEFFSHIDKYVYSMDLASLVWIKNKDEYIKIDQFLWPSNTIEFVVLEKTPAVQ